MAFLACWGVRGFHVARSRRAINKCTPAAAAGGGTRTWNTTVNSALTLGHHRRGLVRAARERPGLFPCWRAATHSPRLLPLVIRVSVYAEGEESSSLTGLMNFYDVEFSFTWITCIHVRIRTRAALCMHTWGRDGEKELLRKWALISWDKACSLELSSVICVCVCVCVCVCGFVGDADEMYTTGVHVSCVRGIKYARPRELS